MEEDFVLNISEPAVPKARPMNGTSKGSNSQAQANGSSTRSGPNKLQRHQPAQAQNHKGGHSSQAAKGQLRQSGKASSIGHKRKSQEIQIDEDTPLFREDSEDEDLAQMISLARKHEQRLEQELGPVNNPQQAAGVVDFDDDEQGQRRSSKKHRSERSHTQSKQPPGSKPAPAPAVAPGTYVHGAGVVPADAVQQVYGDNRSTWQDLGICPAVIEQLTAADFSAPTQVQKAAVPVLLQGRDAMIKAPTGSGKTLAYLVPMIQDLQAHSPRISRGEGTYAIVLVPTRELCIQILDVATVLLKRFHWLVGGMLIGGENRTHEKARLRKGLTLLTATPGRILDHLQNTACFKTDELRWLVLDEADRLLDLGFEAKLKQIIQLLQQKAGREGKLAESGGRAVLLSATLHHQLGSLAEALLSNPVAVGFDQEQATAAQDGSAANGAPQYSLPSQLRQSFIEVECKLRLPALAALLRQKTRSAKTAVAKLVVFISNCAAVEYLHHLLNSIWTTACGSPLLAVPILKLHGDMPQSERTAAFTQFNQSKSSVLLCTDVAARGLDFPEVTTIVQYDVPGDAAEYVHRVGRTARIGHSGEAILFLMPSERAYLDVLSTKGIQLQELQLDTMLRMLPLLEDETGSNMHMAKKKPGRDKPSSDFMAQMVLRRLVATVGRDQELQTRAADAFRSSVRAYATHPSEVKKILHVKALHLGHVANSFALKDTPSMIGQSGSTAERKKKKQAEAKKKVAKEKRSWKQNISKALAEA